MGEREFMIYLDPEERLNRYRHYHVWEHGSIVEFWIQYEAMIEEKWHRMAILIRTLCTPMDRKQKNGSPSTAMQRC